MIYSMNPVIQTNIGSRGRASIGELIVPGDAQNPADSCSLLPSTRPYDPKLLYHPSRLAKEPTNQSFRMSLSALELSKNSTNAKRSANTAIAAAPQTAGQPTEIATSPDTARTTETIKRSATSPIDINDSARSRAPWAKNTIGKTLAAAAAAPQAAEPPSTTTPHAARTIETVKRNTTLTIPPATQYHQDTTPTQHNTVSIEYLLQMSGAIVRGDSNSTDPNYSHLKPQPEPVDFPHLQSNHTAQHTSTSDSADSRAFWAKNTVVKALAVVPAESQAAEPTRVTTSHAARTTEKIKCSTTSPITVIDHDIKLRADTFTGKPKRVDKDGSCLFSSLGGQHAKKLHYGGR